MFRISNDTPAYYLTSVTRNRLLVFRQPALKELVCKALDEARQSAGFLLFAYVVMPDHLHAILGSDLKPSKVAQYVNGIIARRIIDYLKDNGHTISLAKLAHQDRGRGYRYSLWDHHSNIKRLTQEDVFMEKVNYLHQNPVRAGLVDQPGDYRWSSARCWARKPLADEPLAIDIDKIHFWGASHLRK
jgi:REP element-mobilizing transposase RayT